MKKSGAKTQSGKTGRADDWHSIAWTYGLITAAIFQLLILWMAAYKPGDLDGKAVHYYSAARLLADTSRIQAVESAIPGWLQKLDLAQRSRLLDRLNHYASHVIPDACLRGVCAMWPGKGPPGSFSVAVKISFLLTFLLALAVLLGVTAGHPDDAVLLFSCLMAAALGIAHPALASLPADGMGLLTATPRGGAPLLIMAAFAAFSRKRWLLAGLSLLLAVGWHASLAAATVPLCLMAFGLTFCDQAGRPFIRLLASVLLALLGLLLSRLFPGQTTPLAIWVPIAAFSVAMLLAGPKIQNPGLNAAAGLGAFLFLTLALGILLRHPPIASWFARVTGNRVTADLAEQVSGIRHLVSLALPLALGMGLLAEIVPDRIAESLKMGTLLTLATLGLIAAIVAGSGQWKIAGRNIALFAHADEGGMARPVLEAKALPELDPRQKALFFASLGDFLIMSRQ